MISIQKFIFNTFQVNTYLLIEDSGECVVVDAACYDSGEEQKLKDFIVKNNLKVIRNLNTHCHIDHILGNRFIAETFGVYPEYHESSLPFLLAAGEIGRSFGFKIKEMPAPAGFLKDNEKLHFGNSTLQVFYTPGHADGSVCFYCKEQGFVITGDVLFRDTIGRTDMITGDFDLLMKSIREKLFTLPDNTVVYAGHGLETSLGYEKLNNPFIR
ncbi:MAG: MBL fold metallo-hydrolase [Bacteroidales bacterium]|jgi:glyoxylase-like metal-dependent hydrolase (beta-lactamase superfamily II)